MDYRKYSLAVGTVLKNGKYDYLITDVLGAGSFGITYKVSTTISLENISTTVNFAVKEFFLKGCYRDEDGCTVVCPESLQPEYKSNLQGFFNEGNLLHDLSRLSKNIIHVNEVFEQFGTAYYVMEYIEGGNLQDWVSANGPLEETAALDMMKKVCDIVEFLHNNNLLHLDIKPSNIMLSHDSDNNKVHPILVDFGLAKQFDMNGKPSTSVIPKGATDSYAPKEQYADITHFNPAIDVYALAATLLFLLTGNHPKSAFDIKPQDIIKGLGPQISVKTRNAILKAMNPDSDSRTPSTKAFRQALLNVSNSEFDDQTPLKRNTKVFENRKRIYKQTTKRKKIIIFATSVIFIALACLLLWTNRKEEKEETIKQNNEIVEKNTNSAEQVPDVNPDSLSTNSKNINEPEEQTHEEAQQKQMPSEMTQKQEGYKNDKSASPSKTDKKGKDHSTDKPASTEKRQSPHSETSKNDVSSTKSNDDILKTPEDNTQNVNAEENQRREEAEELLRQHEINSLLK